MVNLLRSAVILCAVGALSDVRAQSPPGPGSRPAPPQSVAAAPADRVFAGARFSTVPGAEGVPLNVVELGDPARPAILLIHGFRQSYLSWIRQFGSELGTRCHLVAFDLRGHGNSGVPWDTSAYDRSALWGEDVRNVIQATGIDKPLVVGWSYGGNVAMDFARHFPAVPVSGYVLVSSAAGMFPVPPPPPNAPVRPTLSPDLELNVGAVAASGSSLFPASLDPALRHLFDAVAMRVSPFVDRGIAGRFSTNNTDVIGTIQAPVTLVFGRKDVIVAPPVQKRLAQLFPKARVVVFPDSGHAMFLDEAARFNALLAAGPCTASP